MDHLEKQLTAMTILESYNYIHNISFSCPLVLEINMIFNAGLIFTPQVWGPGLRTGTMNFHIPPQSLTVILLLAFDSQHFLT